MLIAYISDIHSNFEAFKAVLNKIDSLKIKQIYCVGDVVGYGPNPNECIQLIIRRKIPCVAGNHDVVCITGDITWFNQIATEAIYWTQNHLDKNHFNWLEKLPKRMNLHTSNYKILLVHGSPQDPIFEYVYEDDVDENFIKNLDYDLIVMGHTHRPFVKRVKNRLVINCGAVGQPRDGINKASFAIFDTEKFDAKIVRVEYDIKTVAEKIIKAKLPMFLASRLYSGV